MIDSAIRVDNLSKQYRIGRAQQRHDTLRDSLVAGLHGAGQRLSSIVRRPFSENASDGAADDTIWALRDVSFEVKRGEVVGIIGRNGAGKSTLLKILTRITEPTEGRAELHGRVGSLLEVGTGFHPELTGRENIYLNGAILGMRRVEIDRQFDEIVAFAEIEKFLDTPVKRYSSGMYVRLAFAVAAHLESEILLVDEVLAVGDTAFQKKCLGKMGDVAREGRTVLFVSHNMGALGTLCPTSIYLVNGALRLRADTTNVVAAYTSDVMCRQASDVAELRTPGFGEVIRFTNIRFDAPDGTCTHLGQPLQFALELRSEALVEGVSIGASIFSQVGTCVGTLITRQQFSAVPDQRLRIVLRVSGVNLAPGSYYAGFSIGFGGREGPRRDLDHVVGLPSFQVLPVANVDNWGAYWNPRWGSLVIDDVELQVAVL